MQCAIYLHLGGCRPQRGDHQQLCHWGLQPHQRGERRQRRDAGFISCADLARQIRCASLSPVLAVRTIVNPSWYFALAFPRQGAHKYLVVREFMPDTCTPRLLQSNGGCWLVENFGPGKYPVLVNCGSLALSSITSANLMSSNGSVILAEGRPEYRLCYRCPTNTITERCDSDGPFFMFCFRVGSD